MADAADEVVGSAVMLTALTSRSLATSRAVVKLDRSGSVPGGIRRR